MKRLKPENRDVVPGYPATAGNGTHGKGPVSALLLCALLCAARDGSAVLPEFGQARIQTVAGNGRADDTAVEIEVAASSMRPGARCVRRTAAEGGQFLQDVKLFPGLNRVTVRTASGTRTAFHPFRVPEHTLRIHMACPGNDGTYRLHVNGLYDYNPGPDAAGGYFVETGEQWQPGVPYHESQTVVYRAAVAGLYRISVSHFTETVDPPVALPTVVSVFSGEELVYRASNADGKELWSVGTLVIHAGDQAGGYAVDGDNRLDLAGQCEMKGFSCPNWTWEELDVTQLAGPNFDGPVYLTVGQAAQFTASGVIRQFMMGSDQAVGIIELFASSDPSVGEIDGLGVLVAKAPGHTQVSCGGYAGDPIDVYVLKAGLVPDYGRDGDIDASDLAMANAGKVFRFWVNDDDDSGFEDDTKAGKQDIPGSASGWLEFDGRDPDWENGSVDGERDWVDFFPVLVDLKSVLDLMGTSGYKYVLKHTDGAVNAYVATDLAQTNAAKHLRDYNYASVHRDATVQEIPATGYELPAAFLNAVKDDGRGVILLEGRTVSTAGKLVVEVQKTDGTTVHSSELALSLDSVEKMFLHKNLRAAGGGSVSVADRTATPNWPDGLCNGKHVVFLHGYSVNEQGARGWHAEMFKRLYWSGNGARFHAVTWYGNESQDWTTLYKCPNYHNNVVNAWKTAPALRGYLAGIRQGNAHICLMAHSLGNMAASCALALDLDAASVYLMLNGAVASEAFDASQANDNMTHSGWASYASPSELRASEWHALFGTNDLRSGLTWQGRFASVAVKTVNFYSSGDQIFDNHLKDSEPDIFEGLWHVNDGRYAWAFQEKRKGSSTYAGGDSYTFSHSSGWRFNSENEPDGWSLLVTQDPDFYAFATPSQASGLSTNLGQLITRPFFGMGSGEYRATLFTTNAATANAWLSNATNEWRVLAGAIPATSLAAGRDSIGLTIVDNFNMNQAVSGSTGIKPSYWPYRGDEVKYSWLHSDIRNMAYLYTFRVFDMIISQGGLK